MSNARTWLARLGLVGLLVGGWYVFGPTIGLLLVGWFLGALSMGIYVAMFPEDAAQQFAEAMGRV